MFKETLSGIRKARGKQPVERKEAMDLAQRREIDAVLVTELTWWGSHFKAYNAYFLGTFPLRCYSWSVAVRPSDSYPVTGPSSRW